MRGDAGQHGQAGSVYGDFLRCGEDPLPQGPQGPWVPYRPQATPAALWRILPMGSPSEPGWARGTWDVVTVPRGLGLAVLEALGVGGHEVGPAVICAVHAEIHIPMPPWNPFLFTRGITVRSADLTCIGAGQLRSGCYGQLWLLPANPDYDRCLTASSLLFDTIHGVRSGRWGHAR